MPLPNLFIIGAQKCGTSSLNHYLKLHPEIAMSPKKELNFFSMEKTWQLGRSWYEEWFEDAPVRGEGSPSYSEYPHYPFVPERIHALSPDARFVYLVRDPIERLISGWHFEHCYRKTLRSFEEVMGTFDDNIQLARSSYGTQLERYLAHFPAERILVLDRDDLLGGRRQALRRVFSFLGVDSEFSDPGFDTEVNVLERARWLTPSGRTAERLLHRTIGKRATGRLRQLLPGRLAALERPPAPRPVVEGELRERLVERLAPEVDRLRALTGQAFSHWSL